MSASKKKLSIRLLKHKNESVFTVSAQSKFPRGLQIKGIEFVKYIIMKLRPSRTPCLNTTIGKKMKKNTNIHSYRVKWISIFGNIDMTILRLQGVSVLSVSGQKFFSEFTLLKIESVSILSV